MRSTKICNVHVGSYVIFGVLAITLYLIALYKPFQSQALIHAARTKSFI
jgi:hypothetical protein